MDVDYSLYLVTSRDLLPPGKGYLESLEESLQGGVTLVQIREKDTDTADFIHIASQSKALCDRYHIPLLINDRVDVALAINADGVHLGQTDISVAEARRLLPNGAIVGVSCNNEEHVRAAVRGGADYVSIGAVWGTKTKVLASPLVGVRNVGKCLEVLDDARVKAVAIGGIKSTNLLRTLHGSVSRTNRALDGVAVVSDIVASSQPRIAARKLSSIFHQFKADLPPPIVIPSGISSGEESILEGVTGLIKVVREANPLVHQITNTVVATQSANVTLALGGSPIMASESQEMEDLSQICNALLVNIGTLQSNEIESMSKAGYFANANGKPVVFDPVGIGASTFRKETIKDLLNIFQASVIKGNAGELAALDGSVEVETKGVDSVGAGFKNPVSFVRNLARKERCTIVLTGPIDYVSDGTTVVSLHNGHKMLGQITGSGCIVGSAIATYCGAVPFSGSQNSENNNDGDEGSKLVQGNMLLSAIAGVLVLTIAGERTAERADVKGPGTFLPALIDEIWAIDGEAIRERADVRIEVL